ncbi:MAG: HD domain-containing protein [Bryobacterales bacterium]|nr:HD domain-containing protein [Bryobacterales bacterium]
MQNSGFRDRLVDLIREAARPVDKFGHQPRLYALTQEVGAGLNYDGEVVFAAVWLHDLGVFVGHRPEDPAELARWDHVAYAVARVPGILREVGFPEEKIEAVLEVIRTHQPKDSPVSIEAIIVRDADILEQLGAIGILRTVSKVGRDTRFSTFTQAVAAFRRALDTLPAQIKLDRTRQLAAAKIAILEAFLAAVHAESGDQLH